MSETADETPAERPAKVLQLHGGALLRGGVKGNRGGGRPPAEIRLRCAGLFDEHVNKAVAILKSKKATDGDKIRALDLLGRYGGLTHSNSETTVVNKPHREAVEKVRRELGLAS